MTNAESPQQTATLTIDQALQQAVGDHQAGRLQEAERLYRAILQTQPNHPDANHNLGVLAVQVKQPAAGLPHFKAALESNPNHGQFWLSYIDALMQAGQSDAARQVLEQGRQRGLQGEAVESLAVRLEGKAQAAEPASGQPPHAIHESLPASSAVPQNSKKKPAKPGKSIRISALHQGKIPSPQVINTLVALSGEGRYAEAATLAQTLTERFPQHVIGWRVLGAAYKMMGRYDDALAPMQKAAELLPSDAAAHNNLAVIFNDLGRLDEAEAGYRRAIQLKPDYADAHYNLGITLQNMGRMDAAVASYRQATQIKPDYAGAHYNLGVILQNMRRLDEAEASYRQVTQIKPDFAEALSNLGNVHMDQGRLAEAEASYRRAIQIKPNYADAHYNLGVALHNMSRLGEAEASYRRAIQLKPDYVEAHCNLGAALQNMARLDEAEASYRRVIEIKPDYVDALNNLAYLFNEQGRTMAALDTIKQSLQIKETGEAKGIFVACVKRLSCTHDDSTIRLTMVRALTEPWGRPSQLARISADLVKLNPDIGGCVTRATDAWPQLLSAEDLYGPNGIQPLADDPLFTGLLGSAPICDIGLERFLAMARHAMLEVATGMAASAGEAGTAFNFYSALARQCFINEYVFYFSDDEIQKASDLRNSLAAALEAKTPVPALWPVAVAAYFPLYSLPFANRLLDNKWPDAVAALLVQQVCEPAEELQLRGTIPRLTNIEDEVSLLVQEQYEENPYPRWVKTAPPGKTINIDTYFSQKFPLVSFKRHGMSGSTEILIAGCGTGQHSIETAQQFQGGHVLGIDLSMSSLSYAKRKTRELGLTSIEYAQADLLKLGSLGRSFDVIDSSGVLHHLADPWTGWQVLLSLLRPGGFMKLGFYSEIARRNIVKARAVIAEKGYGSTANEIRRCRQDLMDLDKSADFGTTLNNSDFFSISACRDLLFHVQEHRLTLTSIDAFLRANGLEFLGFEIDAHVVGAYKLRFPDDRAATHLAQWQIFENENPDTFFGMYQFWIQKSG